MKTISHCDGKIWVDEGGHLNTPLTPEEAREIAHRLQKAAREVEEATRDEEAKKLHRIWSETVAAQRYFGPYRTARRWDEIPEVAKNAWRAVAKEAGLCK